MDSRFYLCAFAGGVASEVLLFSRGEWERHAPNILKAFTFLSAGNMCFLMLGLGVSFFASLKETIWLLATVLTGLFGAMASYRLLFHPLRQFPGPVPARLSVFWVTWQNIPDLRFYVKLRKLHNECGDFVRIRPREISICHPDAVVDVHGPRNRIRKGEFYEQMYPYQNLQMTRDAASHSKKRRYWDKAFHQKSLQEYTPRLTQHWRILFDILSNHAASNKPIDISKHFTHLGFDIVSELTFGQSFDMLRTGNPQPIIDEFLQSKRAVGFLVSPIWLFHLVKSIPAANSRIEYWLTWYAQALAQRAKTPTPTPDFYTHLSQAPDFPSSGPLEAQLAIIAGADTVATTLSNICYLLCKHPAYQHRLHTELSDLPATHGIIDDRLLVDKPLLHGVINEALRLHPPVPGGVQRVTPPEGAIIAGRHIPGDVIVTTPTYALQRDARAFSQPDAFIPERWSTRPELVLRKEAFVAFSYGAFNCAGRPLAMMELRVVVAMVVRGFEMGFAGGREGVCEGFGEGQADCFVLDVGELPLVLRGRE